MPAREVQIEVVKIDQKEKGKIQINLFSVFGWVSKLKWKHYVALSVLLFLLILPFLVQSRTIEPERAQPAELVEEAASIPVSNLNNESFENSLGTQYSFVSTVLLIGVPITVLIGIFVGWNMVGRI